MKQIIGGSVVCLAMTANLAGSAALHATDEGPQRGSLAQNELGEAIERWAIELPAEPRRVAWAPDLDADGSPEVRLLYAVSDPEGGLYSEIRSGVDGSLLYRIAGDSPFDPWPEVLGDVNGDGEVTWADVEAGLTDPAVGPDALRAAFLFRGTNAFRQFSVLDPHALPENVTTPRRDPQRAGDGGFEPDGAIEGRILRVNFGGNAHDVYKDLTPHVEYLKRWEDVDGDGDALDFAAGDDRDPICYTSGDTVTVSSLTFLITQGTYAPGQNDKIVGKVDGIDRFEATDLQQQIVGNTIYINSSDVSSTLVGPSTIALWDEKQIEWRLEIVQLGGEAPPPIQGGDSHHDIHFVLAGAPANPNWQFNYTLLHIGCGRAHGLDGTNELAVANAIFAEFSDRTVYRAEDLLNDQATGQSNAQPMTYYGNWTNLYPRYDLLLEHGDGQCGAWANLFMRCLHAVGVDPFAGQGLDTGEYIKFGYDEDGDTLPIIGGPTQWMLIKTWEFGTPGNPHWFTSQFLGYGYLNVPVVPLTLASWFQSNTYNWQCDGACADVNDQLEFGGLPGQSTANPLSLFENHQIVLVGGTLFDPSYGVTYQAGMTGGHEMLAEIDDTAIAGYARGYLGPQATLSLNELEAECDLNDNGVVEDIYVDAKVLVIKANPSDNQLVILEQRNFAR